MLFSTVVCNARNLAQEYNGSGSLRIPCATRSAPAEEGKLVEEPIRTRVQPMCENTR